MRIIEAPSTTSAVEAVATILFDKMNKSSAVIGLATGNTMIPVYAELVKMAHAGEANFQNCFFFMLDEYLGFPVNHPSSFKSYIEKHFINPLGLKDSQFAFPPAHLADGPNHYEELLKECGGIDLQLLGVGRNGHVGFNEPGSTGDSRTRIVHLTAETIEANKDQFQDVIPEKAISMGIGTILEAKELLMLATGKSKAEQIKYLLNHHDDPQCPATFLKKHHHFTLVLDPDASSRINLNI
jgi:glucosamine-6-phosphate deaminase